MRKTHGTFWIEISSACAFLLVPRLQAGPLEDMKAGEWYEAPNSRLDAVKPNPSPSGATGVSSVMEAWSGGAYDTRRDRLIVWGGGHTDYAGNEIYAFDVGALQWIRVNNPSTDVGGVESSGVYPDGKPRSRHTYNSIQYLPSLDRFCAFGGAGYYPSGQVGSSRTDCFDFDTGRWEKKADTPKPGIGSLSAVDPATGDLWTGQGTLTRYIPSGDAWGKTTEYDNAVYWNYSLVMEADPKRHVLVAVGGGKVYQWNISDLQATISAQSMNTTGDTAIINGNSPGLAYDPVSDAMVAWRGGSDVFTLNPENRVWTRHLKTGGPTPSSAAANGTYGRFRYVPSKNVFVAVNRTGENVFFYKLTDGGGLPILGAKPKRRAGSRVARISQGQVLFKFSSASDRTGKTRWVPDQDARGRMILPMGKP